VSVQETVRAVPDTSPATGIGGFIGRALPPLAAAAVLVVLVTVLASIQLGSTVGPGAAPGPSASIGTLQPGDGLVTVDPPFAIVLAAVLALVAAKAAINAKVRPKYRGVITLAVGAAFAAGWLMVANIDALSGPVSTATPSAPLTDPTDGSDIFAVGPNATIPIGMWVQNSSTLPITIVGLPQDRIATAGPSLPGPVAIGRFADPGVIDPTEPLPFAPITLQPHEMVPLAYLINTGECAATSNTGNLFEVAQVQVAYEVLGITKTSTLFLGSAIRIPLVENCGS
jgi:hypothetical protein